jgi:hypothetical protein
MKMLCESSRQSAALEALAENQFASIYCHVHISSLDTLDLTRDILLSRVTQP